ncbi:MAG: carbamoyltransferase HypF, partial [Rhodobacteraceae bacterium]|nr:carbamoyltransferase HypF [Paracoccaceae bacterium]
TNCTHCGPRFTILRGLPYDRARTTMAPFTLCPECRAEYRNPADRRFHAQPVACPACGPRLWLEPAADPPAQDLIAQDPIAEAAARLVDGEVLAIKGLGGFHLACDATNPGAIAILRQRKRRPAKPLALMAPLAVIRDHADLTPEAEALLQDPAAPILLLAHRGTLPASLAPGQATLGWMLPYTPLHHLLLDAVRRPLVMTSGNLSGEPQVIDNDEARQKLAPFADAFLLHDRAIARRLDDGVERLTARGRMVLRRARGRTPGTLPLPPGLPDRPVAAYGGQLKAAICLTKNHRALLSHHLGDLDDALTLEEFLKADADYARLFDHRPQAIAIDLHPDFRASRHGAERAGALGIPLVRVQHHHAHMAAALGESGWAGGTAVGIILDGLGLGEDGTIWGGEILVGDYREARRVAHLRNAPLPGGDRAQMEPWRNALMRLDQAGLSDLADRLFPDQPRDLLRLAAARGLNASQSASAGRLFDAVAAILGLAPARLSYEGEAAMALETLASRHPEEPGYTFDLDPAPLFHQIAADLPDTPPDLIAARFQNGLAQVFARVARQAATDAGTRTIALSGGCFQNAGLLEATCAALDGYDLCLPGEVPANDGGLAFGQALVALARLESD